MSDPDGQERELDEQEYEALEKAELLGNSGAVWRAARAYYTAGLAAREDWIAERSTVEKERDELRANLRAERSVRNPGSLAFRLNAALAAREEPPHDNEDASSERAGCANPRCLNGANCPGHPWHEDELDQLRRLEAVSRDMNVAAHRGAGFRQAANFYRSRFAAREEPQLAKTHEYEMPESIIVARVAKAITDHRFPGGSGPGIGGPHALEVAEAAIAAFCAAREDTKRPEDMPVFVLKAKDNLALRVVAIYRELCVNEGLSEQAEQVIKAIGEMTEWRIAYPELCKLPDHEHVPVFRAGGGTVDEYLAAGGKVEVITDNLEDALGVRDTERPDGEREEMLNLLERAISLANAPAGQFRQYTREVAPIRALLRKHGRLSDG